MMTTVCKTAGVMLTIGHDGEWPGAIGWKLGHWTNGEIFALVGWWSRKHYTICRHAYNEEVINPLK